MVRERDSFRLSRASVLGAALRAPIGSLFGARDDCRVAHPKKAADKGRDVCSRQVVTARGGDLCPLLFADLREERCRASWILTTPEVGGTARALNVDDRGTTQGRGRSALGPLRHVLRQCALCGGFLA